MKNKRKSKAVTTKYVSAVIGNAIPLTINFSNIERYGKRVADGVILPPNAAGDLDFEPAAIDEIKIYKWLTVNCLLEISNHFYMGDSLVSVNEETPPLELFALGLDLDYAESNAVLPNFRAQIEVLMGEGVFDFKCCEIGQHEVLLSWLVDSSVSDAVVKRISDWLKYEELDDIVAVYESD